MVFRFRKYVLRIPNRLANHLECLGHKKGVSIEFAKGKRLSFQAKIAD